MPADPHILAATDFSVTAGRALARAARLAAERNCALQLLHVVAETPLDVVGDNVLGALAPPFPVESLRDEALERLTRLAADLERRHGVKCTARVDTGRPAAAIAAAAQRGATLLVVGARGSHSRRRSYFGSTAQKLLRLSPCPVLLVRTAARRPFRRVLAPVDFSENARRALADAGRWFPSAEIHVVHAFEHPHEGLMRYAGVEESAIHRYVSRRREVLKRELPRWAGAASVARPLTFHVRHGHPNTVLDRLIDRLRADLVVVAAHGKSEVEQTLLGSVSSHLALSATCDVMLLPGRASRRTGTPKRAHGRVTT
jgi:nucleotide-binding universal stress UspA family protein